MVWDHSILRKSWQPERHEHRVKELQKNEFTQDSLVTQHVPEIASWWLSDNVQNHEINEWNVPIRNMHGMATLKRVNFEDVMSIDDQSKLDAFVITYASMAQIQIRNFQSETVTAMKI